MSDLNTYQENCLQQAVFPKQHWNTYLPLKLAGEAGEVAEKFGKYMRGDKKTAGGVHILDHEDVAKEVGDVLWYCAVLAHYLGYTLKEITDMNNDKLTSRIARGKVMGNGDNR